MILCTAYGLLIYEFTISPITREDKTTKSEEEAKNEKNKD